MRLHSYEMSSLDIQVFWPTQLRTPLLHYNLHDSSDILSAYPL